MKLLITGISGLIGTALNRSLTEHGIEVLGIDLQAKEEQFQGDILNSKTLAEKVKNCSGIIHLAAVSRVVHGQNNPTLCWKTNVEGTRTVLNASFRTSQRPWVVYASSREVYGQKTSFPVSEDAGLAPMNTYGFSKVCSEMEMHYAQAQGLKTAIVRFSNVYGGDNDHADRVIPAFVKAASLNDTLRIDGANNVFDFTHVKDVVKGLLKLVNFMESSRQTLIPTMHFVSGRGTTLGELSDMIRQFGNSDSDIQSAPPRNFDVHSFIGNPEKAMKVLDWRAEISLEDGLQQMMHKTRSAA